MLLKRLVATGAIKAVETHSKQGLYTQVIVPV
jgi:ribosomal protein S25